MNSYRTVYKAASDEFTEKRSRFIGHIMPVTTEEEAAAFIAAKKKEYWDARHNVSAYVLKNGLCRFSDDGEPGGTAGMPVLDVLQKEGLQDCCVVVTRYFGGILLGGGGLVRAYSHAARLAVDAAGRCEMRPCALLSLTCSYAQYGWVGPLTAAAGGTVTDTDFAGEVTLHFRLPLEEREALQVKLTDQSAGTLTLAEEGTGYYPFPL